MQMDYKTLYENKFNLLMILEVQGELGGRNNPNIFKKEYHTIQNFLNTVE